LSYLFIDSTYDLTLGVLDDGLRWLELKTISGQKASAIIQQHAFEILSKYSLKAENLKGIITIKGPGFYTGLRLAEGFADVFSFFGVEQFSLYSYEIPGWCGHQSGVWFTKAYRGEYFIFKWTEDSFETKLLSDKDLLEIDWRMPSFIHSQVSLDGIARSHLQSPILTQELIRNHPEIIFKQALLGKKREPFYFRAPEDEFKANP
jgi:tRNA threonylcarbamoyladenosine biosynthesis protein TsaB